MIAGAPARISKASAGVLSPMSVLAYKSAMPRITSAFAVARAVRISHSPCQRPSFSAAWPSAMVESSVPLPPDERAGRMSRVRTPEEVNQSAADRELMHRMVGGDDGAFASFYRRFAPGLFSMIYQILQDQKESEDVLQEAFVQMWKKASTYDSTRSSLFTWAVMISRNKAIDRIRARQRRSRTVEAAAVETAATGPKFADQADELLGQGEERVRVRSALSRLPEAQRDAIELAFFRGLTQAEISTQLDTPLGTIKARIRRGLLALRDVLEPAT
jgi:RNA polymerase sigma-70 factor (ECF subfamily)